MTIAGIARYWIVNSTVVIFLTHRMDYVSYKQIPAPQTAAKMGMRGVR